MFGILHKMKISYILEGYFNWLWFAVWKPYREKQKELFDKRKSTCEACPLMYKPTRQCSVCGCFIDAKTKVIYDLDDEGKAIDEIDEKTGDIYYACPEQKW